MGGDDGRRRHRGRRLQHRGGRDARAGGTAAAAGAPVQWAPCQTDSAELDLPKDAQCGDLTVPVDYADPDGGTATLALLRFPATGQRIGSLVINPGGPGGSGIDLALNLVDSLPKPVRQRFDLVDSIPAGGLVNACAACNSDHDNDVLRTDPQVDYSPAGVAHRGHREAVRAALRGQDG